MDEFIKESLEINLLLSKQHSIFCKKLIEISPLCQEDDTLVGQFNDYKTNFEDIDEKISNLITWQDNSKGKIEELLKVKESHKEILFTDSKIQIKQAGREI